MTLRHPWARNIQKTVEAWTRVWVSRGQQSRREIREVMGGWASQMGRASGCVVCNRQDTYGPCFLGDYAITGTATANGAE